MFTIKFYPDEHSDRRIVYASRSYAADAVREGKVLFNVIDLKQGFYIRPGQILFIENAAGKTIERIRLDAK